MQIFTNVYKKHFRDLNNVIMTRGDPGFFEGRWTWARRRRTCEHPLCAQHIKGANPVELGVWGGVEPPAGSRGGAPEDFCKVALWRRNLRAPQSPILALKHFARVVYEVPWINSRTEITVCPSSSNCRDSISGPQNFACVTFDVSVLET